MFWHDAGLKGEEEREKTQRRDDNTREREDRKDWLNEEQGDTR